MISSTDVSTDGTELVIKTSRFDYCHTVVSLWNVWAYGLWLTVCRMALETLFAAYQDTIAP